MTGIEYHYAESSGLELVLTRNLGRCYPWHTHTRHWTVGMVQSGSVTLQAAGNTAENSPELLRQVQAGQHFVVPPRVAHCLSVAPESSLAVLCIDAGSMRTDLASTFHAALDARHMGLLAGFAPLLEDLTAGNKGNRPCPAVSRSTLETPVQAVLRLLAEQPDIMYSLEQLASFAGYSRWHFLRCFQKEAGMTPHEFHLACRLRRLRSLLRADTAASTAAVSTGFADQSHMQRVFKLHHGLTPKQFRQASFRA